MLTYYIDDSVKVIKTTESEIEVTCLNKTYLITHKPLFWGTIQVGKDVIGFDSETHFTVKCHSLNERIGIFQSSIEAIIAIKRHATKLAEQDIQQTLQQYGIIEQQDGDGNE